jgi:hypothetical protein
MDEGVLSDCSPMAASQDFPHVRNVGGLKAKGLAARVRTLTIPELVFFQTPP